MNEQDIDGRAIPLILAVIAIRAVAPYIIRAAAAYTAKQAIPQVAKKTPAPIIKKETQKVAPKVISAPKNLREQLAIKQVKANPEIGEHIMKSKIKDPRYLKESGWQKMRYTHRPLTSKAGGKIVIHYFYNTTTKAVSQLKIKHRGR